MNKRIFLGQLATLLGLGAAVPLVARGASRAIELQRSPVAGFQYHQGEAVWSRLEVGARLDLVREPDNAYDPRAVRVDWQGHKLGYVPRVDNAAVGHLLNQGIALEAEIIALQESPDPWERAAFSVRLRA